MNEFFSLRHRVLTGCGENSASYPAITGAVSVEIKRLGRDAYHSPPSSIEVNNTWSYSSTSPYVFMALFAVKRRETLPSPCNCYCCNTGFGVLQKTYPYIPTLPNTPSWCGAYLSTGTTLLYFTPTAS
jgi:hypothetical protein